MYKKIPHSSLVYACVAAVAFFVFGITVGVNLNQNGAVVAGITHLFETDASNTSANTSAAQQRPNQSCIKIPADIDQTAIDFDLLWSVWESLKDSFYKQPISDRQAFYGAVRGIVSSVHDPYTVFFDPSEAEEFNKELEGKFEGIGAEIGIKHDRLTIIAPLPESPAEKAGLRPGDIIFAIDDKDTSNISTEEAVTLIRGVSGTKVVLTILSAGASDAREVAVTRGEIIIKTVTVKKVGINKDIAYIRIFSFNEDTSRDFKKAVQTILANRPKALILDLRSNPGGFLDSAVDTASYWIREGAIVRERFSDQSEDTYSSLGFGKFKDIKTIVLVNQGSASASEIVAGALQDAKKATILGEQTFGKGSVQDYSSLKDGSALKITIAEWLTPNGRSINFEGITPDIIIPFSNDDFNKDIDPQLDKAIELLE
jgi:carboxyl-terminal processing protease